MKIATAYIDSRRRVRVEVCNEPPQVQSPVIRGRLATRKEKQWVGVK